MSSLCPLVGVRRRIFAVWRDRSGRAVLLTAVAALLIALSGLQWQINGSQSPYATDIGEIQNALPRWGTLHFTGYPVYTALGSLFVTLLRWLGVQPAAGASLYSAIWAAVAMALFVRLLIDLRVSPALAALAALLVMTSTSMWMDSAIAEIHTMTRALSLASVWLALRVGRAQGPAQGRRDLLWLTLVYTQAVAHQRAAGYLAPALLLLVWPQRRLLWRNWAPILGLAALAPLTYLYLPIRAWQGATWTFGEPGTWTGFWTMILDTKMERIVTVPDSATDVIGRLRILSDLVRQDLTLPAALAGLLGLLVSLRRYRWNEALAFVAAAAAALALSLVIWEGRISDALLATELPMLFMLGIGVALLAQWLSGLKPALAYALPVALALAVAGTFFLHRPAVIAVTRDPAGLEVIEQVEAAAEQAGHSGDAPIAFMALWGHDYWALAYAQEYLGRFPELYMVDHNADLPALVAQGLRLMTLEKTLYQRPLEWWQERLGAPPHLTSVAPGVIELAAEPPLSADGLPPISDGAVALGNGIEALSAGLLVADGQVTLTVYWHASQAPQGDYSVAVHLLAQDPPVGQEDILAQADRQHPVYGWYPTSQWQAGEIVRDDYVLPIPAGSTPVAVRVGMYQVDADGTFHNSEWLTLPWPQAGS